MSRFCIKEGYTERTSVPSWDDTSNQDECQKLIYEMAKEVLEEYNFNSVLDIGCGSGFKLVKYFNNCKTLGIDVPRTVEYLKQRYSDKFWTDVFEPVQGYDFVICSDVVEHFEDSNVLMEMLQKCNAKLLVISTPDRDSRNISEHNGPPSWEYHYREWNTQEFGQYVSLFFDVINHVNIPNESSQCILAKMKS